MLTSNIKSRFAKKYTKATRLFMTVSGFSECATKYTGAQKTHLRFTRKVWRILTQPGMLSKSAGNPETTNVDETSCHSRASISLLKHDHINSSIILVPETIITHSSYTPCPSQKWARKWRDLPKQYAHGQETTRPSFNIRHTMQAVSKTAARIFWPETTPVLPGYNGSSKWKTCIRSTQLQ